MSKVKVLAGSFEPTDGIWYKETFRLWSRGTRASSWIPSVPNVQIPASHLQTFEIATEENVKRAAGTAGWAAIGLVALGPIGLLAGLILGGKGKDVTFIAEFRDGRKLLATVDSRTYTEILAAKGL